MLAQARSGAETFTIQLGVAAPESELVAWFQDARPGESAIYASGFTLPREAAGVKLVAAWQAEGWAHLKQRRDPDDARRWQFLVERSSRIAAGERKPRPKNEEITRIQMGKLLQALRRVADRGEALPSYRSLARDLTTDNTRACKKGIERVRHLLRRLHDERRIELIPAPNGARHGPQVTILAKGRGCGRTTACASGKGKV
jgi:hypothetical protein